VGVQTQRSNGLLKFIYRDTCLILHVTFCTGIMLLKHGSCSAGTISIHNSLNKTESSLPTLLRCVFGPVVSVLLLVLAHVLPQAAVWYYRRLV